MAFCCRPSLIVLDEPTTGLDVSTQRHVLDTVRSLYSSYGVAAFYVSHDLAVVAELVAEVAVMYAGRIVEIGPTANLRKTVGQIVAQPLEQLLGLGFTERSERVIGVLEARRSSSPNSAGSSWSVSSP